MTSNYETQVSNFYGTPGGEWLKKYVRFNRSDFHKIKYTAFRETQVCYQKSVSICQLFFNDVFGCGEKSTLLYEFRHAIVQCDGNCNLSLYVWIGFKTILFLSNT